MKKINVKTHKQSHSTACAPGVDLSNILFSRIIFTKLNAVFTQFIKYHYQWALLCLELLWHRSGWPRTTVDFFPHSSLGGQKGSQLTITLQIIIIMMRMMMIKMINKSTVNKSDSNIVTLRYTVIKFLRYMVIKILFHMIHDLWKQDNCNYYINFEILNWVDPFSICLLLMLKNLVLVCF